MKLNLGCGKKKKEGWVNLDIEKKCKPDVVCDIENGLPFKDNTFDEIYASHCLEHIRPNKLGFVMDEIARVCEDNSKITIFCPYFSCSITFKTIDHKTPISYFIFDKIEKLKVVSKKMYFFRVGSEYQTSKIITIIGRILNPILSFFPNSFPLLYERLFCWTFPMEEIKFVLIKESQKEIEK